MLASIKCPSGLWILQFQQSRRLKPEGMGLCIRAAPDMLIVIGATSVALSASYRWLLVPAVRFA